MKALEQVVISSMVNILRELDATSLALVYASAQVLKARQDMEKTEKTAG